MAFFRLHRKRENVSRGRGALIHYLYRYVADGGVAKVWNVAEYGGVDGDCCLEVAAMQRGNLHHMGNWRVFCYTWRPNRRRQVICPLLKL